MDIQGRDLCLSYIKDDETAELVARLARLCGLSKQEAVKVAVKAALTKASEQTSVREKLHKLWAENPLPPPRKARRQEVFRRSVGWVLTIFADASALIAIMTAEHEAIVLADRLQQDRERLYSAISAWETVAGLSHACQVSVEQSRDPCGCS